jgi:hypothetical protein
VDKISEKISTREKLYGRAATVVISQRGLWCEKIYSAIFPRSSPMKKRSLCLYLSQVRFLQRGKENHNLEF